MDSKYMGIKYTGNKKIDIIIFAVHEPAVSRPLIGIKAIVQTIIHIFFKYKIL